MSRKSRSQGFHYAVIDEILSRSSPIKDVSSLVLRKVHMLKTLICSTNRILSRNPLSRIVPHKPWADKMQPKVFAGVSALFFCLLSQHASGRHTHGRRPCAKTLERKAWYVICTFVAGSKPFKTSTLIYLKAHLEPWRKARIHRGREMSDECDCVF